MNAASQQPWRIEYGERSRFAALRGFAVIDPFGLRVGTVSGVVLRDPDDVRFLCIRSANISWTDSERILPLAYVTLIDPDRRYVQLSHLDRGAFEDICPVIDGTISSIPFFQQYTRIFAKPSETVVAAIGSLRDERPSNS